jgi:glycosyltransferase involved in cell wall biosynthesis
MKRRILAAACKRNVRYAHVVVTPNDSERRDGIRHGLWGPEEALTVPNGVDTDRFRPEGRAEARRALGLSPDRPVVGVVARLTREKGVDLAIETVRMLRGVTLVIVGDGPERESLETQVDSLYVTDRTIFTDARENVEEFLPAFDVCLVPSRTEGHGMVAAEALACGVPVVASRVGGLQSLVIHEQTGLMVEPEDVIGYARAIDRLINDRPLATALGSAGRAHMVASFSYQAMVTGTMELYGRLLSRYGSNAAVPVEATP